MSGERDRARRLGRMLAVGQHRERASQYEFARAVARSADAAAQLSHIEGLILTAGPDAAARGGIGLMAGAQLRNLLMPAAAAAEERLQAARAERRAAEERLAVSRARMRKLSDMDAAARRALSDQALSREMDGRPATRRRQF